MLTKIPPPPERNANKQQYLSNLMTYNQELKQLIWLLQNTNHEQKSYINTS